MHEIECPYCGANQRVNVDNVNFDNEYELHAHECKECEKSFSFRAVISIDLYAQKADCLNGGKHELTYIKSWPSKFSKVECKCCNFTRPAAEKEIEKQEVIE